MRRSSTLLKRKKIGKVNMGVITEKKHFPNKTNKFKYKGSLAYDVMLYTTS